MAQRLNPIRINYQQPSDVAGLAGARAAQQEFDAISQNQARKVSEGQAFVEASLKAREVIGRISEGQQRLKLDTAKAQHSMQLGREELAHKQFVADAEIDAMNRKLPVEIAGIQARTEAQLIENRWADAEAKARISGMQLTNKMNEADLLRFEQEQKEVANSADWRDNAQKQINAGVDPDDIVWPTPKTEAGRKALADIKADITGSTRAQMNDMANAEAMAALTSLSDAQENNLRSIPDSFDANGNLTDVGRAGAKRMAATNSMNANDRKEIEDELIQHTTSIRMPTRRGMLSGRTPKPYDLAEYINGQLVLTDAGVREVAARERMRKELFTTTKKTVTVEDGKTKEVIEYTPKNIYIGEKWEALAREWRRNNDGETMSDATMRKLYDDARQMASQVVNVNPDGSLQISQSMLDRARENGTSLSYTDADGQTQFIDPAAVGATDMAGSAAGGAPGGGAKSQAQEVIESSAHIAELKVPFEYDKNLAKEDVDTTMDDATWNLTVAANSGTHWAKMKEWGWSDEEAKWMIDYWLNVEANPFDPEGPGDWRTPSRGSDTHGLVEDGIQQIANELDKPSEELWDLIKGTQAEDLGWREADEITWTKIVADKQWQALMKEEDTSKWVGKTMTFNWQKEPFWDVYSPNTRGRHRLPLRNYKQRTFKHTWRENEDLPAIQAKLKVIFEKAEDLKRLNELSPKGKPYVSAGRFPEGL
jgi:hypothetical protein